MNLIQEIENAKFTKGEWKTEIVSEDCAIIYSGNTDIAKTSLYEDCDYLANANLIAAAPDMLEALKKVLEVEADSQDSYDVDYGLDAIMEEIKSAVKKALGI